MVRSSRNRPRNPLRNRPAFRPAVPTPSQLPFSKAPPPEARGITGCSRGSGSARSRFVRPNGADYSRRTRPMRPLCSSVRQAPHRGHRKSPPNPGGGEEFQIGEEHPSPSAKRRTRAGSPALPSCDSPRAADPSLKSRKESGQLPSRRSNRRPKPPQNPSASEPEKLRLEQEYELVLGRRAPGPRPTNPEAAETPPFAPGRPVGPNASQRHPRAAVFASDQFLPTSPRIAQLRHGELAPGFSRERARMPKPARGQIPPGGARAVRAESGRSRKYSRAVFRAELGEMARGRRPRKRTTTWHCVFVKWGLLEKPSAEFQKFRQSHRSRPRLPLHPCSGCNAFLGLGFPWSKASRHRRDRV